MRHRPTLSIPKPCHENWQAMTPAAQGRHCAACNKVVVDFTHMTDAEILAYLGHSSGAGCGRFRQEQLDRPLMMPLPDSGAPWRKRLLAVAALIGLGTATAPLVRAQQATPTKAPQPLIITLGMVATQPVFSPTSLPPQVVRGVVLDSTTHDPLPGVTVMLAGTTIGISSDKDGKFELTLPETSRGRGQVHFSFIGYKMQQQPVSAFLNEPLTIELAPENRMLSGELMIVGGFDTRSRWYTPRGMWQRLKRPFQRW